MSDYSKGLYESYVFDRQKAAKVDVDIHRSYIKEYVEKNYRKILPYSEEQVNVLEIGCGCGDMYLAIKNILPNMSYMGIDLSPEDCKVAESIVGKNDKIYYIDAFDFLSNHCEEYDIIVMKAVLEHIDKDKTIPLLRLIYQSLKKDGKFIVDVPNMDWFLASHERYMDFTHEVGFNECSLEQVITKVFGNADIVFAQTPRMFKKMRTLKRIIHGIATWIVGSLIIGCEPQMNRKQIMSREIIGIAEKKI